MSGIESLVIDEFFRIVEIFCWFRFLSFVHILINLTLNILIKKLFIQQLCHSKIVLHKCFHLRSNKYLCHFFNSSKNSLCTNHHWRIYILHNPLSHLYSILHHIHLHFCKHICLIHVSCYPSTHLHKHLHQLFLKSPFLLTCYL